MEKKRSFGESLPIYRQALSWIEDQGFNVKITRLAEYEKEVTEVLEKGIDLALPEYEQTYESFISSLFSANLFIQIFEDFPREHMGHLRLKLEDILGGPKLSDKESKKNSHPRNTQYEILLACMFARHEFQIDFVKKAGEEKEDVRVEFGNIPLLIECKRPLSMNGIDTNLRRGIQQLHDRLIENSDAARGILCISFDKFPGQNNLVLRFKDEETASKTFDKHLVSFLTPYKKRLSKPKHPNILGLIGSLNLPIRYETSPNDIHLLNYNAFIPFEIDDGTNKRIMKSINSEIIERGKRISKL